MDNPELGITLHDFWYSSPTMDAIIKFSSNHIGQQMCVHSRAMEVDAAICRARISQLLPSTTKIKIKTEQGERRDKWVFGLILTILFFLESSSHCA
jgi:hypothetical protein